MGFDDVLSGITATITGPRRKSLFPEAARPAVPCATYCYHATRVQPECDNALSASVDSEVNNVRSRPENVIRNNKDARVIFDENAIAAKFRMCN